MAQPRRHWTEREPCYRVAMHKRAIYLSCYDKHHENPPLVIGGVDEEFDKYSRIFEEIQAEFRATVKQPP